MIPWAAVVGHPVSRSLSPRIFRAFSAALGRPLHYRAFTLRPEALAGALKTAARAPMGPRPIGAADREHGLPRGSWVGWNVTLPHKVAALELMDELDSTAREAQAVNVVRFDGGRCIGYNTDAEGFLASLDRSRPLAPGARAVVFGAGGAARAACAALRRRCVGSLLVLCREPGRAAGLARAFDAAVVGWGEARRRRAVAEADIVVNATPLGMDGRLSPLPAGAAFKRGALAYDLVYRPAQTPFLKAARASGAWTLGGLPMLAAQAAATWRVWFGAEPPGTLVERVERELAERP